MGIAPYAILSYLFVGWHDHMSPRFCAVISCQIDKNHKAEGETPSAYYGRKIDEKSFCLLQVLRYPTVVKNHRKELLQKY